MLHLMFLVLDLTFLLTVLLMAVEEVVCCHRVVADLRGFRCLDPWKSPENGFVVDFVAFSWLLFATRWVVDRLMRCVG